VSDLLKRSIHILHRHLDRLNHTLQLKISKMIITNTLLHLFSYLFHICIYLAWPNAVHWLHRYSIRFEDKTTKNGARKTRVKFCTDGVLLRECLQNKTLDGYVIVIVILCCRASIMLYYIICLVFMSTVLPIYRVLMSIPPTSFLPSW